MHAAQRSTAPRRKPIRRNGVPAWEIAHLFPMQGEWDEDDYLDLDTNLRVEFTDGWLEVLDMPFTSHERIAFFLATLLAAFSDSKSLGEALPAGVRIRLRTGKYRVPDLAFMLTKHADRVHERYWDGADLVMEVLSKGKANRDRDLRKKKGDYATAQISEYWIIDPVKRLILIYTLEGKSYRLLGRFRSGQRATSALLSGFGVDVNAVFAVAQRKHV